MAKTATRPKIEIQPVYLGSRDRHRIYVCTTYAHNTKACTDHRIYYEDLYIAVLADIQHHARLAFEDREKAVALAVKMNARMDGNRGKATKQN